MPLDSATTLIRIYGGKVKDLETLLLEERLPKHWEAAPRERFGLTMFSFNKTVKQINSQIDEEKVEANLKKEH